VSIVGVLFRFTERGDWVFIVLATVIWGSALAVTAWDFVVLQGGIYRFGMVNALGLGLCVAGFSLREVARRTLGRYYTYGLKMLRDHRLVKHGVYRYVRHPIYFAAFLYNSGFPLLFSSLYGFVLMQGFVPLTLYRIGVEERILIERFGDEYREYMKKTKKLIPLIY